VESPINQQENKYIEALVPRSLVGNCNQVLSAPVTAEGLCPVRIRVEYGRIVYLEGISHSSPSSLKLLLPRLAEPHAHLDKAFTWSEAPNLRGEYQTALAANLAEKKNRTFESVYFRAEKALLLALKNGLRAVRSHVDSCGQKSCQSWEALLRLKKRWRSLIELQLVALAPLESWGTEHGKLFARDVAKSGGLLGGVLVPPFDRKLSRALLLQILTLAEELGCGIDLHIDESHIEPAAGLKQLIQVLEQFDIHVPITCSHSSSMGLLPPSELRYLAERLAYYRVKVVVLPLTNFWLLGRGKRRTPVERPLAPILQLQQAGVIVGVGGDNVQDPWFPGGNFDPISLMSYAMPLAQLVPWQRIGLSPFTTAASALMDLSWDGTIQIDSPADFVLLEANSWSEALSTPPFRKVMVNGKWLDEKSIPLHKTTDNLT